MTVKGVGEIAPTTVARVRLRRLESTYRWIDNGTRWRGRKQSCVPVVGGYSVDVSVILKPDSTVFDVPPELWAKKGGKKLTPV